MEIQDAFVRMKNGEIYKLGIITEFSITTSIDASVCGTLCFHSIAKIPESESYGAEITSEEFAKLLEE